MAVTVTGTTYVETHASGTGSAPTLATDGQGTKGLDALTLIVEADSGQTLSGAGNLRCYTYDPSPGPAAWVRLPGADLLVNLSAVRRMGFNGFEVIVPRNSRVVWIPDTVTLSGGGLTIYQMGFNKSLKDIYV